MNIAPIDRTRLPVTDQELRDLAANEADGDWFVRTADDLKQLREAGDNPYARLPDDAFETFLASLKFANGGVSGGSYKPLTDNLGLLDVIDAFAHLGMSMELFTRADNASCLECKCPGCTFSFTDFCSSLCPAAKVGVER